MAEQIVLTSLNTNLNVDASMDHSTAGRPVDSAVVDPERSHIDRARMGDLASFDWLIDKYRERATRLATQVMRRPADAEDVVQESFLRAFAQIKSFRSESSFYTWFYRIVVRLSLNRMRTPEYRHQRILETEMNLGTPRCSTAGPTETKALVETLLDQLSPQLRTTLVLREVTGLEYEEIAETLGVPIGTVRSRLNAARFQFKLLWLQIQEETQNA